MFPQWTDRTVRERLEYLRQLHQEAETWRLLRARPRASWRRRFALALLRLAARMEPDLTPEPRREDAPLVG